MTGTLTTPADVTWTDKLGLAEPHMPGFIGPHLPALDTWQVNYLAQTLRDRCADANQRAAVNRAEGRYEVSYMWEDRAAAFGDAAHRLQHLALMAR